ncbi:HAD family hydrolase [Natronomonas salsuginis]|uniref:HAD family hydrolase n=1 Tax=Natronomonas salsuginis TaxID=2217661 RepID=A0A4U5JI23_9EURY|nr:HAD family hydrolase [Natronomonas salsuginis]TKR27688.1 HAD family hydrolase [Natronomonas salsuginis]
MSSYRTVFWDIGGVIVELKSIREGYAAFIEDLAADADLDSSPALDRWTSALGEHFKGREKPRYRLARDGYAKATAELFDNDPPADWGARLEAAVSAAVRPKLGAPETIRRLSGTDVDQSIVSDIDTPEAHLLLGALDVRDRFDHITTSEAVGYTKPDERMFRDALDALSADPDATLMIGDRYGHDIVGAAALDIDTVGYGPDATGPKTTYEIDDLREVPGIVGIDG